MLKSKLWLFRHNDQIDPKTVYKSNTHISKNYMCVNIMCEYSHNSQSLEGEQWNKTDPNHCTNDYKPHMPEMADDPRIIGILHRLQDACEIESKHIHKFRVPLCFLSIVCMCVHIICTEGMEHVACYACEGQRTALWCPFTPSVFVFPGSNVMHTSVRQTPFPCWSISPTLRLLNK